MSDPQPVPPTPEGKYLGILNAIKGLTLQNVMIIALLVVIAIPAYVIWKALSDDKLLDRLMSTYEEVEHQNIGCAVRHVQERGGPELWGVSSGFAFQGADRWYVNVVLTHDPSDEELVSYCESLKLIADRMLSLNGGSSEIHPGPMSRPTPDRSGYNGDMPAAAEER